MSVSVEQWAQLCRDDAHHVIVIVVKIWGGNRRRNACFVSLKG